MLFGRKKRKPIKIPCKKVAQWKYTTCNYCSTGCSIEIGLNEDNKIVTTRGDAGADVNRGKLCIKGILEHELFESPGRGTEPLIREKHFEDFKKTSWDLAYKKVVEKIKETSAEKIAGLTGDLTNMETMFIVKEFFQKTIKSQYLDSRADNYYVNSNDRQNYIFNK